MSAERKSELLTTEDYWAIWIGFALIIAGLFIFLNLRPPRMEKTIEQANETMKEESRRAPFKTVEWFLANDEKEGIKATQTQTGSFLKTLTGKPRSWKKNPLHSLFLSDEKAEKTARVQKQIYQKKMERSDELMQSALIAEKMAREDNFKNTALNTKAKAAIEKWRKAQIEAKAAKKKILKSGYNQIVYLIPLALILAFLFAAGNFFMEKKFWQFIGGFLFIFVIAVISYILEKQTLMQNYGIGYAFWAIVIGLIISNTVGTPKWVMPAVKTEYIIKTGLVLLGAEILFGKIIQIGIPGLFVAWIVTPTVIIISFIIGRKYIKVPSNELNITISSAVSVCGVSAAIATSAACRAKKEELTLAVGMSLIFTAVMMILMPAFIKAVGMAEILGGAWIGGVVDSTGAVAAAGAFLGEKALYVSATIKMIQNILIGVVAFFVAIYWTMKMEKREDSTKPNAMEIWYRFPKFVLGFAAASVLASVISYFLGEDTAYVLIDNGLIGGMTKNLRGWMFCLAFVSIGLSTNFRELRSHLKGGKPFILYVFGQTFNLLLTLLIAWLMFYVVFPGITEGI